MTLPGVSLSKADGALGTVSQAPSKPLYVGVSSGGTPGELGTVSQPGDVNAAIGYGPLATEIQIYLNDSGGSVDYIVAAPSTVATSGSFSSDTGGTTVLTGTPRDTYGFLAEITTTGILSTGTASARFKYSLDQGETYSAPQIVSGSYSIQNTGLTLTFANGTYTEGQEISFVSHAPQLTAADLGTAMTNYMISGRTPSFIRVAGDFTTSAAAKQVASQMSTILASLDSKYVFTQAIMSAGGESESDAAVAASWQAFDFVPAQSGMVVASQARRPLPVPFKGYGAPKLPFGALVAAHAGKFDIATSPAAVKQGSLVGAYDPNYDEFQDGELYLPERLVAPRTVPGRGGLYLNQSVSKSPAGSDYNSFERLRVMNRATQIVNEALTKYINDITSVLTDGSGYIDPVAADAIDADVNNQLKAGLFNVQRIDGRQGYCSALQFAVNRETDILATGILYGTAQIVPLAKISNIVITLSFAREIVA